MDRPPEPLLPDFADANLTAVVPALLAHLARSRGQPQRETEPGRSTEPPPADPPWLTAALGPERSARQVVLLVLDGLGWRQLDQHRRLAPTLASGAGGPITSVAPSTTATALTSLTTGLPPAVHGVVGYRLQADGVVMNVLKWRLGGVDARQRVPAGRFQPYPPFPGSPRPVPVVTRSDYSATGFSAAHLGGTERHGWSTASGLVVDVAALVASGAPLVYAYYDGVDRTAHARGLGDHYRAELVAADRLVADLLEVMPPDAALIVTADHGQVEVGTSIEVLGGELMEAVTLLTGEGRFRWLHVVPGAADDVCAAARELHGEVAWVRTRDELVAEGWLGGEPVPEVAARLGDVALAPFTATAFLDPADTGELRLRGRHGSLTEDEMLVPLLGWLAPPR